jgi:hypothetical protein
MAEDPAPLYCTTCANELVAINASETTVVFARVDMNLVIDKCPFVKVRVTVVRVEVATALYVFRSDVNHGYRGRV